MLKRLWLSWRRASHLTGINAARKELVQLNQFVRSDVELERDAVEGIVRSHLSDGTETIQTNRTPLPMSRAGTVSLTMNSTVPGGLLFSLFAWFLFLQPLSMR